MRNQYKLLPLLVCTSLVMANIPVAAAAGQTFEVTAQSTVADIQAAIVNPDYDLIKFVENVSLNDGLTVSRPVDFLVEDGVTVNIDDTTPGGPVGALVFAAASTFTNNGTVNIVSPNGYGIHFLQAAPADNTVVLTGDGGRDKPSESVFNIGPSEFYGVDGQFIRGNFTVADTTLNVTAGEENKEAPMIFSSRSYNENSTVLFENSNVQLNHNSEKSKARVAFYTELPVIFDNTDFKSTSLYRYNFSAVNRNPNTAKPRPDVTFRNGTSAILVTPQNALTSWSALLKGYVSLNTFHNSINIEDSSLMSENDPPFPFKKTDFQFENSTYNVSGSSTIKGETLGIDTSRDDQATGSLNILGDATSGPNVIKQSDIVFDVPNGTMPENLAVIIDSGTVDLPTGAKAKNSLGQDLVEFESAGSLTDALTVNCSSSPNDEYAYRTPRTNLDGKKHVWAPPVAVEYYESETSTNLLAEKTLIAGSTIAETLNYPDAISKPVPVPDTAPTGFENEFYIFDPVTPEPNTFIQSGPDATAVCQDTKVALRVKALGIIPIMDVDTEDLTVNVGHVFDPAEGLLNVPDGATVEVISEADTSKPDQVTRTVKVTFKDGSSVVKEINVTVIGDDPVDPPTDPTGSSTGEIVGLVIGIISAIILLINIPAIINFFQSLFQVPAPAPAPEKPMKPGTPKGKGILKPGLAK
ncbi:Rib/alpha-like domain-containing protein [Corynebacterium sp. ES2730-CONJ]|uniref:Rib/alpha-like domain-containing protein n=1 Tax=Corynebacterium sp. ES2730-CONJ TaxID=2973941 RepID=UPI00216AD0D2|nr:Rib/alpha-like domain-containing protein [Corynebacterium sp. ES2730-CONJ]MCS4531984.1 Rib/alpha-like domain-containing protein [Corynebacterium sp. ES2730-CONJ]